MKVGPDSSEDPVRTIGKLCVGADWACTNGDVETLEHLARRIAMHAAEPVRSSLLAVADLCGRDPGNAVDAWMRVKDQVLRTDTRAAPSAK